jgi:hypothetical protein
MIEKFNHRYPLRYLPDLPRFRTIEIGGGVGGHLAAQLYISFGMLVVLNHRP